MRKVRKKRQNVSEDVGKQEPSYQLSCQQSAPRENHSPEAQGAAVLSELWGCQLGAWAGMAWNHFKWLSAAVNELPGYLQELPGCGPTGERPGWHSGLGT